jgi:hypothetical protein
VTNRVAERSVVIRNYRKSRRAIQAVATELQSSVAHRHYLLFVDKKLKLKLYYYNVGKHDRSLCNNHQYSAM